MMKLYFLIFLALANFPFILCAQNVGIGAPATRARMEVSGAGGSGASSAIFGSDGIGISFQQNWPSVGFNQYRNLPTGYGKYMGPGFAAVQYMDPATGAFALDMQSVSGFKDNAIVGEFHRAFSIFNNGTVSFGKGNNNSNLVVDYLNINGSNTANGSVYLYGTQYPSYINLSGGSGMVTQIGPGKDGGTTYINDLTGNPIVIGGSGTKVGINTNPLYLTTLSIRHAQAGGGLALIEQNSYNNWEWYVSNDFPLVWMGQKYNGLLIGDYNPNTGQHGYVSDRRLKNNIRSLAPVIDKLMALQPMEYRMKTQKEDARPSFGFIAQELKKLFPELVFVVSPNDPGSKALPELHMVNYSQLFVVALKAIQEQQAEIADLLKEIEHIEKSRK